MSDIENIYEGTLPRQLAFVLKQLEEMGVKRQDTDRSVAQSGSAAGLGPVGRRFKSCRSDQFGLKLTEQKKPQPPQE